MPYSSLGVVFYFVAVFGVGVGAPVLPGKLASVRSLFVLFPADLSCRDNGIAPFCSLTLVKHSTETFRT